MGQVWYLIVSIPDLCILAYLIDLFLVQYLKYETKKLAVRIAVCPNTPEFTLYLGCSRSRQPLVSNSGPLYLSICVATCEYQEYGILTSVDSDEPVQPPFKPRNSKCCSVSSLTVKE